MPPRKQEKQRDKNEEPKNYFLIIALSSIIVILLAALIACLINIRLSEEPNVVEKLPETDSLVEVKNEVKRLRYWGVVLHVWHTAGEF